LFSLFGGSVFLNISALCEEEKKKKEVCYRRKFFYKHAGGGGGGGETSIMVIKYFSLRSQVSKWGKIGLNQSARARACVYVCVYIPIFPHSHSDFFICSIQHGSQI